MCRQLWEPQMCCVSGICFPCLSFFIIAFRCSPWCTQYKVQRHAEGCQPVFLRFLPRSGKFTAILLYFFGTVQILTIAWVCFLSLLIPSSMPCICVSTMVPLLAFGIHFCLGNSSSQTWLQLIRVVWIHSKRFNFRDQRAEKMFNAPQVMLICNQGWEPRP